MTCVTGGSKMQNVFFPQAGESAATSRSLGNLRFSVAINIIHL